MPVPNSSVDQYSTGIGLIYIFNLIVGTGALTLPAVFCKAGWALGTVIVLVLALISYVTVTFVIESMASANAIITWNRIQSRKRPRDHFGETEPTNSDAEDTPLVLQDSGSDDNNDVSNLFYNIQEKLEMGEIASILFNKCGISLFYICLAVYLYGDLSIYGAAIGKSMADIACTYQPPNISCNQTIPPTEICWEYSDFTRFDVYRVFLTTFVCLLGPFAFFDVKKTQYLQLFTSAMRWLAFFVMIVYAVRILVVNGPQGSPPAANRLGIPGLFGACVYSFMCHHSLPGLVAPISNKSGLNRYLFFDYVAIAFFYLLLALTGAFAFAQLDDLYTLDFGPRSCSRNTNILIILLEYFLALFPVFTLSTSFPIIAITLRNNLQSLFLDSEITHNYCLRKILFPLLAIIPPYAIAMTTQDLKFLVGITGSYAGAGIQYLIPTIFVYYARKKTGIIIGPEIRNKFSSPFSGNSWLIFVVLWAVVCMILVSINLIEANNSNVSTL